MFGIVPGKESAHDANENEKHDHEESKDQQVLMAHGPSVNPPRAGQRAGKEKRGSHSLTHQRNEDRGTERVAGAARAPALVSMK